METNKGGEGHDTGGKKCQWCERLEGKLVFVLMLRREAPSHRPAVVPACLPERARSEEEVGVDVGVPLPSTWLL